MEKDGRLQGTAGAYFGDGRPDRALIGKPEILFADEPTGNLDSRTGAGIMTLLREINQDTGQTILMVTHSPEAAKSSTRLITVQDGVII